MKQVLRIVLPVIFLISVVILLVQNAKIKIQPQKTYTEIQPAETIQATPDNPSVPLMSGQDVIRTYASFISEKKIVEAVDMMDIRDETTKQSWGVYLNSFSSLAVKRIDPYSEDGWTDTHQTFQVLFSAQMKPEAAYAAIPNYGWEDGDNVRWVSLIKSNTAWKLAEIATGP